MELNLLKTEVHKSKCTLVDSQSWVSKMFLGTGGGTGNLATVNDEAKNVDLKLLLEMAYPYRGKDHRYRGKDNMGKDHSNILLN